MNKAVTEGLVLMPTAFEKGLDVWSSEDGRPGDATYASAFNAAFVPADGDFGGALEIVKQETTTQLRYTGEIPVQPGLYLKITARVKALSGNLPRVRVAGWPGSSTFSKVSNLVTEGPETELTAYGEVVEVSAIVGSGSRGGVDMPWGIDAVYGHFGLDFTGGNGGTIRIDDITIEDVSSYFLTDSLGYVDVRDYGAVGDGTTDCTDAFNAADNAANGKRVFVPAGEYFLASDVTILNEVEFEGTLKMDAAKRFILRRNFHLNSYIDAFGDELEAFKKAFQALLNFTDHNSLDLCGRRIELTEPLDMQALAENVTKSEVRRVIHNGQLNAKASTDWDTDVITSSASYSIADPRYLRDVDNIANITVGTLVSGTGVGREVYVKAVDVGTQTIELSQKLFGANPNQTYTFKRFKYIFDFSRFVKLRQITIDDVDFLCNGNASAVMLCPIGSLMQLRDCQIHSPADRGVTSPGTGCQDLFIDRCFFVSKEQSVTVAERTTIAFNVNSNDAKIRENRFSRFLHTGILHGNGHLITGNHWFQGDNEVDSPSNAGLILTFPNSKSVITGNYIDNSFVELTNEHDAQPDFGIEYSFGGLTLTGNIFTAYDVAPWFSWIVVTPYGEGHFIEGLSVQGNTFKALNGSIQRIEKVDTTYAELDKSRMRNIVFSGNTFNAVDNRTVNPVSLEFNKSSPDTTWVLDPSRYLPFEGWTRVVESIVFTAQPTNSSGQTVSAMPYAQDAYGTNANQVRLHFPEATRGRVQMVTRIDNPV